MTYMYIQLSLDSFHMYMCVINLVTTNMHLNDCLEIINILVVSYCLFKINVVVFMIVTWPTPKH